MANYVPKIRKFSGNEDSVQWLEDYVSEIEGSGGPGTRTKHVYFSRCLEGVADEWYCHDLEYKAKLYWDLLSSAFLARWKTAALDNVATVGLRSKAPRLAKDPPSSSTNEALRLSQERARDQRAEKRAAKKEEQRVIADELKAEGNEHFKQRKYKDAAIAFERACEIAGPHPVYLSNAAAAYLKLDEFQLAVIATTNALVQDPRLVKARYRRGMARKGLNQLRAAISDFETVLQVDPNCNEARVELAIVRHLWESGEGEETGNGSSTDEFPHLDEDGVEIDSESDSSDYEHQGNGIPCRFYNHDGCNKGTRCSFSHAPDEKSIRDELGRNVCLYYLLGSCKFGDLKCVYSHSKRFLPQVGWWTTEEGRQNCRDNMEIEKEGRREMRTFNRLRGRLNKPGTSSPMNGGGVRGIRQLAVGSIGQSKARAPTKTTAVLCVLLLSLGYADTFNSIHKHFLAALHSVADVIQSETKESALESLARPNISGVFVTDPEITEKKYAKVLSKLVEYAKAGGTVVIGGTFSTFIGGSDNDAFFKKAWGLNWKMGSYHRTTFSLNPSRPERLFGGPSLAASYSMKTVHLKGVAPEAVVYGPTPESRTQSMVFAPSPVDLSEAPVVYTRIDQGFLGYIGDVNGEIDSTNVILSMLGLPEQSSKGRDACKDDGSRRRGPGKENSTCRRGWDTEDESDDDDWDE